MNHGSPMARHAGAVLAAAALAVLGPQTGAIAADALVSHEATYRITLAAAEGDSGVVGADGTMHYRFADACDGWTMENRTALRIHYRNAPDGATLWSLAGWESKDGLAYRFQVRHRQNGETAETLRGHGKLARLGGPGTARFSTPPGVIVDLPAGTLFPAHHLSALLDAAAGGADRFSRPLFDGASLDNPYLVSGIVAGPDTGTVPAAAEGLPKAPAWRMRLAFFPIHSRDAEPDFELDARYRADGIAHQIRQDFGGFTLDMRLEEVELLPAPEC